MKIRICCAQIKFLLCIFLSNGAWAAGIQLPMTGQTITYAPGDDGALQAGVPWPTQRFQINTENTITDNLTGLTWIRRGKDVALTPTWKAALDYVASLNGGRSCGQGETDCWRLPNIVELESLSNIGSSTSPGCPSTDVWLNQVGFDNLEIMSSGCASYYWSSTATPSDTGDPNVASVQLYNGEVNFITYGNGSNPSAVNPASYHYTLAVRGGTAGTINNVNPTIPWKTGQTTSYYPGDDGATKIGAEWPNPRFQDNGDGTVTDNLTHLVWLKDANCFGNISSWDQALQVVGMFNTNPGNYSCSNYRALFNDWRMPNRKELFSIVDFSQVNLSSFTLPLSVGNPFANSISMDGWWSHWSSSTFLPNPSYAWTSLSGANIVISDKMPSPYDPPSWMQQGSKLWLVRNQGTIPTPFIPPTANAGQNATQHVGSIATLDATGSSDISGNTPLTYAWNFVSVPSGSNTSLSDPTSLHPTFIADKIGDYVIQLVVTNSIGVASAPVTITISAQNTAPVSDPGPDQSIILISSTVTLKGSLSFDNDGDPLTYSWTLNAPAGSSATLDNPNAANPTFVADIKGTYTATLVVYDPWAASAAKKVVVSFTNIKPVANAGTSVSSVIGNAVLLNGTSSSDPNGDSLTYRWALVSLPQGSTSALSNPASATPSFTPDLPGNYIAQLIVNDGMVDSDPSTVEINAITIATQITQEVQSTAQQPIALLNTIVFKNPMLQNALLNKINAIITNVSANNYQSAINQLNNDVLSKTDGCATLGVPDKNDWINDCAVQAEIYSNIVAIINQLKSHKGGSRLEPLGTFIPQ